MEEIKIKVDKRDVLGKKVRFLRRQGVVPVHLFGHGVESQALQCDADELKGIIDQAGMSRLVSLKVAGDKQSRKVFIREVQRDFINGGILHVDFYQIKMKEKIKADIPVVLVGESPALRLKGRILNQDLSAMSVECLPDKLPPQVEVDLSQLEELDQAVHVSDIDLGDDVVIHTPAEQLIVKVSEIRMAKEEGVAVEEEAVEGAEGEAVTEEGAKAEGAAE